MPTNTTNYQLVKPALTDSPPDITAMNPNWDKIDHEMKKNADSAKVAQTFETAGGTGTAITITSFEFVNGVSRTFVASAANNGAATTLNGKPVYKPNTTSSPNIVAGKAYTVWYSTAGGCFFLKASAEGNAVAANVLAGTTFSNDDDTGIPGEMVDNGPAAADTVNLTTHNQEYTIAKGYHSGLRKIKAVITNLTAEVIKAGTTVGGILGTFTSDATATAGNILSGAIAYVNGNKITGTMANRGKVTQSLGINGSYTIPEGYHDGTGVVSQSVPIKGAATITPGTATQVISAGQYLSGDQTIAGDADLVSANIKSGANIFGVAGNPNVVDTSPGTALYTHILSGKIAFVDGVQLNGGMKNNGAWATNLTSQGQAVTVPVGYHSGAGKVTANITNLAAGNVREGVNVGGVVGNVKPVGSLSISNILCETAYQSSGSLRGIGAVGSSHIFSAVNEKYTTAAFLYVQMGDWGYDNNRFTVSVSSGTVYVHCKWSTNTEVATVTPSSPFVQTRYSPNIIIINPEKVTVTVTITTYTGSENVYRVTLIS